MGENGDGGGGFDPCECLMSQEAATQRLLSLLRNTQNYCTDSECNQEMPGPSGTPDMFGGSMFYIMMLWMAIAFALYFLRPKSVRPNTSEKPADGGPGPSGQPPAPPVM